MTTRFLLNKQDGKLMGVASGLADLSGVDPLVVRLAFILALMATGPIAAILYVATGLLATDR